MHWVIGQFQRSVTITFWEATEWFVYVVILSIKLYSKLKDNVKRYATYVCITRHWGLTKPQGEFTYNNNPIAIAIKNLQLAGVGPQSSWYTAVTNVGPTLDQHWGYCQLT